MLKTFAMLVAKSTEIQKAIKSIVDNAIQSDVNTRKDIKAVCKEFQNDDLVSKIKSASGLIINVIMIVIGYAISKMF